MGGIVWVMYPHATLLLAFAGTLFSGYIALHRLIVKECPFNEECPEFLGRPACEYGFAMFLIIFLVSLFAGLGQLAEFEANTMIYWVSLTGVCFSGYYIAHDMLGVVRAGMRYGLVLPTCVYGFLCFVIVFVLSILH